MHLLTNPTANILHRNYDKGGGQNPEKKTPLETLQQLGLETNQDKMTALSKGMGGCRMEMFEAAINEDSGRFTRRLIRREKRRRWEKGMKYTSKE